MKRPGFALSMFALLMAAGLSACTSEGAPPVSEAAAVSVEDYCASPSGLLILGGQSSGIYYVDDQRMTSAMLPGSGEGDLALNVTNASGLGQYKGHLYYFENDPFGQNILYETDLRLQDRRSVARFSAQSGVPVMVGNGAWYVHDCCYVVLYRHELHPDPAQNRQQAELLRIRLGDGRTDVLFRSAAEQPELPQILTADSKNIYFAVQPVVPLETAPAAVQSGGMSRLYRCAATAGEPELMHETLEHIGWFTPFDAGPPNALYYSLNESIYAFDPVSGAASRVAEVPGLHSIYAVIRGEMYCLLKTPGAEVQWVALNLKQKTVVAKADSGILPRSESRGCIIGLSNRDGLVLIRQSDFDAENWSAAVPFQQMIP